MLVRLIICTLQQEVTFNCFNLTIIYPSSVKKEFFIFDS